MKTVVFYYTQSGQALKAAKSICQPMEEVVYKQIVPWQTYPYPWSGADFFDTFPETRLSLPPSGIEPIDLTDVEDADLVMIVGQSWFLSPSLPLQSFFADDDMRRYLKGRKVVFVNVCRNMWLMTVRKVKACLKEAEACLVGHIVLQDEAPNLVSVVTVIRWLIYGRQEASLLFPRSGVSEEDLAAATRFGKIIGNAFRSGDYSSLQDHLLSAGAIHYKPSVMFMEKTGHRMFGFWARFVRRKGGFRDPRRRFRLRLFATYLLAVLFLVSPFGQLFFFLTYPLQRTGRHRQEDCSV